MKQRLLAAFALIALTNLAHAQALTITGAGRMGFQYDGDGFGGGTHWRSEQRLTLDFDVAIDADNGLTLGAWSRARMQTSGRHTAGGGVFSGGRVWVAINSLRLTFGNQDGALQTVGLVGETETGYTGGTSAGGTASILTATQSKSRGSSANRIGLEYSAHHVTLRVSHDRAGVAGPLSGTEIGVSTRVGSVSVAAGYANRRVIAGAFAPNSSISTLSGRYNGNRWTVGLIAAHFEGLGTNYALTGTARLGAGTLRGYVGRNRDGLATTSDATLGLGFDYRLGAGATMSAGAERLNGVNTAEVGVVFNF